MCELIACGTVVFLVPTSLYTYTVFALLVLSGLRAWSLELPPSGVWTPPKWSERRAEFQKSNDADHRAVVFYGDSITEGWTALATDFSGIHTANRGIYGDLASNIKFRIQEDVIDLAPIAVVILIGTNDVKDGTPPLLIVNNIKTAAEAIHSKVPDAKLIICQLMPRSPRPGMEQEKQFLPNQIPKVNSLIEKMLSQLPYIYICDTFHPLANPDSTPKLKYFVDGVHPNALGYKEWKAALMPIFRTWKLCP